MSSVLERPRIEVRIDELNDLLDERDPTPIPGRCLNPHISEFIMSWAYELATNAELELLVHVSQPISPEAAERAELAVRGAFDTEADTEIRKLKDLFRGGRIALAFGLAALVGFVTVSRALVNATGWLEILREGLAVAGWVALWRPLEIYLYDWWPIRRSIRTYRRLERATIRFIEH